MRSAWVTVAAAVAERLLLAPVPAFRWTLPGRAADVESSTTVIASGSPSGVAVSVFHATPSATRALGSGVSRFRPRAPPQPAAGDLRPRLRRAGRVLGAHVTAVPAPESGIVTSRAVGRHANGSCANSRGRCREMGGMRILIVQRSRYLPLTEAPAPTPPLICEELD